MLLFLGDVKLDKPCSISFEFDSPYIFNLETPISKRGTPAKNKVVFRNERSYIKETFGHYPLAVNLANNHIMDYGPEAFEDTLNFLQKHDVKYFGAGTFTDNCNNPAIIQHDGKDILLFGYCCESTNAIFATDSQPGCALLNEKKIIEDIQKYKKGDNFIVVNCHWGEEYNHCPKYEDRMLAHRLIDAGADLVIGHHAHVIQPVEIYKGKHIFYGLGHFIFPDTDVDAYFDGEKFTKRFVKKMDRYSRHGLVACIDSQGNVTYFTTFFNDKTVYKKYFKIPKFLPSNQNDFLKKRILYKRRNHILKFFSNPKIPKIKHIRLLLQMK